jgi:hypothetical protein
LAAPDVEEGTAEGRRILRCRGIKREAEDEGKVDGEDREVKRYVVVLPQSSLSPPLFLDFHVEVLIARYSTRTEEAAQEETAQGRTAQEETAQEEAAEE